jgi:hypothetical protein
MATITDIADAIVAELNGHAFSEELTAVRFYRPVFDLGEMSDLHVSVVPKGVIIERADRTTNQEEYAVDVAVQKKFHAGDNAELDALMSLVEEVAGFFRFRRLVTYPIACWVRTENAPVFSPGHLEEFRQFTSVLTLTYRVVR